jgi:histidinol dehydrogenase
MSDDLVKRLRDPLLGYPDCFHQAAADRIEAQAAEITRLRAELATARRDAMEEPAQRLEELHKNHGYNSRTGKVHHGGKLVECPLTIEHSIGYYRAIVEGVAHIRAASGEGK